MKKTGWYFLYSFIIFLYIHDEDPWTYSGAPLPLFKEDFLKSKYNPSKGTWGFVSWVVGKFFLIEYILCSDDVLPTWYDLKFLRSVCNFKDFKVADITSNWSYYFLFVCGGWRGGGELVLFGVRWGHLRIRGTSPITLEYIVGIEKKGCLDCVILSHGSSLWCYVLRAHNGMTNWVWT